MDVDVGSGCSSCGGQAQWQGHRQDREMVAGRGADGIWRDGHSRRLYTEEEVCHVLDGKVEEAAGEWGGGGNVYPKLYGVARLVPSPLCVGYGTSNLCPKSYE